MATSAALLVLNVVHVIFGLAITAVGIWFFTEVYGITSLRNANHYLLDYNVYWPQAIPWVFLLAGIFVICVSCCGFAGAKKRSSGTVKTYIVFQVIVILILIAATVVALAFADSESTNKFIKDTIWDAYTQIKDNRDVEVAFGNIERRLQCCGASGPRDYINWKREFPISCCDTYYHGLIGNYPIECDVWNKMANERHGCTEVAANYARIVIKVLAGASAFTALIGIVCVAIAVTWSKKLNKKPRVMQAQNEFESKKVLL